MHLRPASGYLLRHSKTVCATLRSASRATETSARLHAAVVVCWWATHHRDSDLCCEWRSSAILLAEVRRTYLRGVPLGMRSACSPSGATGRPVTFCEPAAALRDGEVGDGDTARPRCKCSYSQCHYRYCQRLGPYFSVRAHLLIRQVASNSSTSARPTLCAPLWSRLSSRTEDRDVGRCIETREADAEPTDAEP